MAAVRGLRVSVKAEAPAGPALGLPSPEVESGLERGEPEPMEVEEGELEIVPVRRSLKELLPVRARGAGAEEVAERVSLARQGGGGQRRWRKSGNAGEGRERRKAGAAHDPESAREKGRRGARKWVQRALEEAGGDLGKSRGHPCRCPSVRARGPERINCVCLEIKGSRGREQNLDQP